MKIRLIIISVAWENGLSERKKYIAMLPPSTHSFHSRYYRYTLTKKQQHRTGGTDTGMLLGEDSWLARGSEVTDPQTPDLLREAGRKSKARHNFLTLLAHNRLNTGWHTLRPFLLPLH